VEDLAVVGYNIEMDLKGVDEVADWIHVAEDWDMWRAIVNAVMNLRFP
jgi:hypothetical protein